MSELQIRGGAHDGEVVEIGAGVPPTTIRRTDADGATVTYTLFHATRRDRSCEWFYAPPGWPRVRDADTR